MTSKIMNFILGVFGFGLATFTFSVFSVIFQINGSGAIDLLKIVVILPLFEELTRFLFLMNLSFNKDTDSFRKLEDHEIFIFSFGWFSCELCIKFMTNVNFSESRFLGIPYLGGAQPLLVHFLLTLIASRLVTSRHAWYLVVGLTLVIHSLYNAIVLFSRGQEYCVFELDDLLLSVAFLCLLVSKFFWRSKGRKI
jgi:hypothetical protein